MLRRLAFAALLAIFLGRIVLTYRVFNDTFDEGFHIAAGLEVLQRGRYTLEAQHPPLARVLLAVLPHYFGGLRLSPFNELWGHGAWSQGDLRFYWRTLALARAGNLFFAVILFWFVYRWSSALYGLRAGLMACLLAACCPNLIAHASLATLDLAAAATILMSAYFFWRWSQRPGLRYCLASALSFGVAVLSKFSALLFLPPIALWFFFIARWKRRDHVTSQALWTGLWRAAAFALAVGFVIWAGYGFEIGAIAPPGHQFAGFHSSGPGSLSALVFQILAPRRLPAYKLAQGIGELLSHNELGHSAYLLGRSSGRGWWYYFPVAVAVKSTIPLLLLVVLAIFAACRKGGGLDRAVYPLVAMLAVLGVSMFGHINIGVRHVLPVFPFFAIAASALFAGEDWFSRERRVLSTATFVLVAWHAGESVLAHPDYLAYFNQIARGREEQFLLDSNLDWGQDLARLGEYLRENQIQSVTLSYFGRCDPAKMGVHGPELSQEKPQGWVAVSLSNLMMREELGWLRERKPVARIGKSIWLFYVESR